MAGKAVVGRAAPAQLAVLLERVNNTLADYEQLKMVVVSSEPWTVENGLLTPTLKLRRNRVEASVEKRLDQWYASGQPVVWA